MLKTLRFVLPSLVILLAGCGLINSLFQYLSAPPPKQYGGAFATLAVNVYTGPGWCCLGYLNGGTVPGAGTDPITDTDNFAQLLKGNAWNPWSQINRSIESNVLATSFQQYQGSIDALMINGHGAPGTVALTNIDTSGYSNDRQRWGVGDDYGNNVGQQSLDYARNYGTGQSFPISGRLKWIFALTSDTVSASSHVDPYDSHWTGSWVPAFGGSLHGIYGSWQYPLNGVNRSPDVTNGDTGKLFAQIAEPTGPSTQGTYIHDAWVDAFMQDGQDGRWSIYEDSAARNDELGGPGPGGSSGPPSYTGTLSGSTLYYYPVSSNPITVTSVTVNPTTFVLNPQSLANENIDAAAIAAQYEPQAVASPILNSNTTSSYSANTNYGGSQQTYASGALVYYGPSPESSVTFSPSTSLTAAQNFVATTFGMPSDAVLYSTLNFWQYSESNGSAVNDAVEYIWHHANPSIGGYDAIKAVVSDRRQSVRTCTAFNENDPPNNKPLCVQWGTTVTDTSYISSAYRLWRSLAGTNSTIQPAGTTSIDAQTASTALPSGVVITGYASGWWYPNLLTSSSVGARAAWIFNVNGTSRIGVDAYTGQILGSTTEL